MKEIKNRSDAQISLPNPELYEQSTLIPGLSKEEIECYIDIILGNKDRRNVKYNENINTGEPRMPVIAVGGMPNSLKTAVIEWVINPLQDAGIKADYIPEPEPTFDKRKYPIDYAISMWYKTLEELRKRDKANDQLLILDRSVYDSIAFLNAHLSDLYMNHRDGLKHSLKFIAAIDFLTRFHGETSDILIINETDPKRCLEREQATPKGPVMQEKFLHNLHSSYQWLPASIVRSNPFTHSRILKPRYFSKPLFFAQMDTSSIKKGETYDYDKLPTHERRENWGIIVHDWEDYSSLFLKTVGTFCRIYTSGGKIH